MDMKTALFLTYQTARSAHYAGQQLTLPFLDRLATGRKRPLPEDFEAKRLQTLNALFDLLKEDSTRISAGVYPWEVLKPEGPGTHWGRFARILMDGWRISHRKEKKDAHDFDDEARVYLEEVPEYYRRNFHFQTGGYLTRQSARLYEHQVEILFAGGADAMRRLILPLMREKWPGDGEGLHFLEVAAGTGRLSRFVKLAYPKARVTVTDLSWPYLQEARSRLADLDRVEFMQAAAENLPFKDATYDAVYSCFLFHELPHAVRRQVVREGMRLLRPGGLYGLVDSLQKNDGEEFQWALEQFPTEFHEPFFKNYTSHPMEKLLEDAGLQGARCQRGFLAKGLVAEKP
ncbi:MAG: class I SAM-dependent methyltransferase [Bdellovibrionaceae bacterium]|nr:class I SAM-dependent methyltransferase [Pseudobdellovibrionaceae bacterium]MBX3033368.1 class I SAM-dependent methyltransferase [Pseudobdellovibrionaceae bacterium]